MPERQSMRVKKSRTCAASPSAPAKTRLFTDDPDGIGGEDVACPGSHVEEGFGITTGVVVDYYQFRVVPESGRTAMLRS